jgi:hypothetical protein
VTLATNIKHLAFAIYDLATNPRKIPKLILKRYTTKPTPPSNIDSPLPIGDDVQLTVPETIVTRGGGSSSTVPDSKTIVQTMAGRVASVRMFLWRAAKYLSIAFAVAVLAAVGGRKCSPCVKLVSWALCE